MDAKRPLGDLYEATKWYSSLFDKMGFPGGSSTNQLTTNYKWL